MDRTGRGVPPLPKQVRYRAAPHPELGGNLTTGSGASASLARCARGRSIQRHHALIRLVGRQDTVGERPNDTHPHTGLDRVGLT